MSLSTERQQSPKLATQHHYSIPEIAELWGLSEDTCRKILKSEPGILRLRRPGIGKRRTVLKVPQTVLDRVHAKLAEVR